MKKTLILALALAAGVLSAVPAVAATNVGVSIEVSQPGVYGRIDLGQWGRPQVVVQQPVLVYREPRYREVEPVYMWVPPGHRKNWKKHCRDYNACGAPVYFVQDRWYDDHVRKGRRDDRADRRDDRRDDHPGRGNGKGKGNKHD